MKTFSAIIIILFGVLMFSQNKKAEVKTVNYVDLKKYVGLWYEIARMPNSFQEDCVRGITAEYQIMEDGRISVKNSCIEADGNEDAAEGVARVVDKKTNSKLEVSFVSIFGMNIFWGDYWIIGLDENYKYAVIGHPERKYGWILARSKELTKDELDKVYNILIEQGYDWKSFKFSKQ